MRACHTAALLAGQVNLAHPLSQATKSSRSHQRSKFFSCMPEGPEIRRAADKIEAVLKDKIVEAIHFGLPPLKKFAKPLTGSRVAALETRGKALLTHFDSGLTIYSHNQLYGVWRIVKRDKLPKTNRQLRLAIHTDRHSALLYSASDISVWKTEKSKTTRSCDALVPTYSTLISPGGRWLSGFKAKPSLAGRSTRSFWIRPFWPGSVITCVARFYL